MGIVVKIVRDNEDFRIDDLQLDFLNAELPLQILS